MLWMLPMFGVAVFGSRWSTQSVASGYEIGSSYIVALELLIAGLWLALLRRRIRPEPLALALMLALDIVLGIRMHRLAQEFSQAPGLPAFFPVFGFIPIFIIVAFVLMPARWAIGNACLLALVTLSAAAPIIQVGMAEEPIRFGTRQLLLFVLLGLPVLTAVLWGLFETEWLRRDGERLRELTTRYRESLAATRDGLFEWADVSRPGMWWSDRMFEMLGASESEATVDTLMQRAHPQDAEALAAIFSPSPEALGKFRRKLRLRGPSGEFGWFELRGQRRAHPIHGLQVAGSLQDINEQRNAELRLERAAIELEQSERRFRQAFEQAALGIVLAPVDGRRSRANPALCEILGRSAEDILERNIMELVHEDDRDIDQTERTALLSGDGGSYVVEKRLLHASGREVPCRLNVSLVRHADGTPAHFVIQVQDISQDVERSRALNAMLRELQRSNEELEAFAYTASHDLKAPLRTVSSFGRLLQRRLSAHLSEDDAELFDLIITAAGTMEALIEELLRFARLGRGDLQLEEVDLRALAESVASDFARGADGVQPRIEIAPDLPRLRCDPVRVRQIFQNLISNAIKYNCSDEPLVRISARADTRTWICVDDNGIGIPPHQRERVFALFRRLHLPGEYGGGTGVGLTSVRKLVDMHGGEIRIVDSPLGGTRFEFTLEAEYDAGSPFAPSAAADPPAPGRTG